MVYATYRREAINDEIDKTLDKAAGAVTATEYNLSDKERDEQAEEAVELIYSVQRQLNFLRSLDN